MRRNPHTFRERLTWRRRPHCPGEVPPFWEKIIPETSSGCVSVETSPCLYQLCVYESPKICRKAGRHATTLQINSFSPCSLSFKIQSKPIHPVHETAGEWVQLPVRPNGQQKVELCSMQQNISKSILHEIVTLDCHIPGTYSTNANLQEIFVILL